jgi:integrase
VSPCCHHPPDPIRNEKAPRRTGPVRGKAGDARTSGAGGGSSPAAVRPIFRCRTVSLRVGLSDNGDDNALVLKGPKNERSKRTITIDDDLIALLCAEREKYLRLKAGVPDGAPVNLSLVKLPDDALLFPAPPGPGESFSFAKLRNPANTTKEFARKARALGFPGLCLKDLRSTHETLLLDAGVPVHVVAARCGHDPAVLLRIYAKRTKKADTSAASIIGALAKGILGT